MSEQRIRASCYPLVIVKPNHLQVKQAAKGEYPFDRLQIPPLRPLVPGVDGEYPVFILESVSSFVGGLRRVPEVLQVGPCSFS